MSGGVVRSLKPYVPAPIRRLVARSIRERVEREAEAAMAAEGLVPIESIEPEDVIIVGYPKSGTTWLRFLVSGVVYGVNLALTPPGMLNRLVPDPQDRKSQYYQRFQTPMVFKSHYLPRADYRRVIYMLRDGRDVMVSLHHHLRREGTIDGSIGMAELITTRELLFPCPWHEHVEAWDDNPFGADKITIRYEDLLEDPVEEIRRVCEFMGIERDPAMLSAVAAQGAFQRLQDRERHLRTTSGGEPSPDELFFRRGTAGSHRDEMSADALALFLEQAGHTLERLGYPIDRQLAPTRPVST